MTIRRRPSDIDGLSEPMRLAVELISRGKTLREVARTLNIAERTLYGWRMRPEFQRAVYSCQQDMVDAGGGAGVTVMPNAVETLVSIMNDPNARDSDRIAASRALISGAQAFQERKMLARTIADLERQLYGAPVSDVDAVPVVSDDSTG